MTARAISLVGCGYIYGATGWICTPSRLAQQEKQYPSFAKQMKRYGKKWMGKPCYDCAQLNARRGKTGGHIAAQRRNVTGAAGIWKEKDVIDTLPDEAGIFLFTMRNGRMRTGVSIGNGEEVDARGHAYGVVRRKISETSYNDIGRGWQLTTTRRLKRRILYPNRRSRPFAQGSRGEDVRILQENLRQLGFLNDAADGIFGTNTNTAVRSFQKAQGLSVDGVVGAGTWATGAAMPQEEEEPSVMTRLCLTGRTMVALLDALNQPEETEKGMRLVLSRSDYGELMRQIRLEAD
ncbi:MAG: peptidoglycan-binding domain-containing protein [Christensenellales bacterium]